MSHLDCLDDDARQDALSIMHRVRDQYEKPLQMPQRRKGKYIDPNVTFDDILNNDDVSERDSSKKGHPALLLCMPYFCLAPYSTYSPATPSEIYPLRTLLQSWHMSTAKKRDLQQAVCQLGYSPKDHVFHIPQIWCLILGNSKSTQMNRILPFHGRSFDQSPLIILDLLVSCTPSPPTDVKRGLSGIKVQAASTEDNHDVLRISDGGSRVWLLAVTNCMTWLVWSPSQKITWYGFLAHCLIGIHLQF